MKRNALTDALAIVFAVSLKTTKVDMRRQISTDKQAVNKTDCAVFVQLMSLTV